MKASYCSFVNDRATRMSSFTLNRFRLMDFTATKDKILTRLSTSHRNNSNFFLLLLYRGVVFNLG